MTPHDWQPGEIFVFGSNLAGRHGKGAALDAVMSYGAVEGQGDGHYGQSYALPTKSRRLEPLPLGVIGRYARAFCDYARDHRELKFFLTRVGCGYAGYVDADIAPFFKDAPSNVRKPDGW